MRVLVTGAGGFIGSHVAESAVAAGHSVRGVVLPGGDTSLLQTWGPLGVLMGWLGGPLIQRDRQAALGRFKAQVEARVRQATGEPERIPA